MIPVWLVPVLIAGGLTTVFLSPALWMPGPAWLILGYVLVRNLTAGPSLQSVEGPA